VSSSPARRIVLVAVLAASLTGGPALLPASATPGAQAAALSRLKADWNKQPLSVKKGTCAEFGKWPESTIAHATTAAWAVKKNHKNMSVAEWLKVYRAFYKWAC
jgi:hypothetical protein